MNWDSLLVQVISGQAESFMIKRMSFKRMIRSSCRVEPRSTRHEIDLPKKQGLFRISQFIWTLQIHSFFLFKAQPLSLCFTSKLFADEEMSKGASYSQTNPPTSLYKRWFIKKTQEKHFELLINRQRWLRTNRSLLMDLSVLIL
uniref:Uncharacterized protein n=1 Tax=Helianthus annuus TaxID=4232 RepID=A0A1Y3BWE4_HELAN